MIVIFILTKFGFFSICKSHYWECVEVKHNQWTCLTNSKPRDANDKNSANHSLVYLIWGEQQILLPKITPNTLHPTDLVQKQWTRVPPNWGRPGFFFSLRSRDWKRGDILIIFFLGGLSENIDPRAVEARGRDEMIHSVCQQLTRLVVWLSSMSNKPPPQSFDQNLINCSIVFSATRFQCLWQKINK